MAGDTMGIFCDVNFIAFNEPPASKRYMSAWAS